MRIITGSARGAVLTTLEGEATRPTSSKVKEAIFSSIQFDLEGRRFLDLFAGSGQMGLEALSRGAEKAVMVDNSREAIEIMKANAQKTHLYQKTSILCMDFQQYIRSARGKIQFDIVFLDPPYALRLIPRLRAPCMTRGCLRKAPSSSARTIKAALPKTQRFQHASGSSKKCATVGFSSPILPEDGRDGRVKPRECKGGQDEPQTRFDSRDLRSRHAGTSCRHSDGGGHLRENNRLYPCQSGQAMYV